MMNSIFASEQDYEIRQSPLHGLGLFATRDIAAGTHVIRYSGPIVSTEIREKMTPEEKLYLYKIDDNYSIDGSPLWNTARYINHKCSGNNCESRRIWMDHTKEHPEVWIIAKTFIKNGDELTYSYGRGYWCNSKKRVCKCGELDCYGTKKDWPTNEKPEDTATVNVRDQDPIFHTTSSLVA